LVLLAATVCGCQDPPETVLREAERALRDARAVEATRFAASAYRRAAELTQSGRIEIARQKGRLAPLRDFAAADSLLRDATKVARRARDEAVRSRDSVSRLVDAQIRQLVAEHGDLDTALGQSLTYNRLSGHMLEADMYLKSARRLADQGEFKESQEALGRARGALKQVIDEMTSFASESATRRDVWRRWVRETVEDSRKVGTYAIIVDKSRHILYLLKGGRILERYSCDLGFNPARQKLFSGDARTPEGQYHVVKVRRNGSRYYKALLLDYPNELDRRRFASNRQRGAIPSGARIGGLIEIHGEGGRGIDWTEGCVALSNSDMDELMEYVSEGTAVTIVRDSDRWP
jgi:hypothetical protein